MEIIKGQGVCKGIVFAKLRQIANRASLIKQEHIEDIGFELARYEKACDTAKYELTQLYEKALSEVGEQNAMIFDIHKMMLDDTDYVSSVKSIIKERKLNAESAVAITGDNFADMFKAMDDTYMQARANDVKDISERLLVILRGDKDDIYDITGHTAIASEDLTPSQTVQLDKNKIVAFITEGGSINSHTSILARTMNVPAVINAKGIMKQEFNESDVIIDGFEGVVYINPDAETVSRMKKRKDKDEKHNALLEQLKGVEPVTKDGKKIMLYANIGNIDDLLLVYKNGAQGVGLFRSEFVYLESNTYPTEDEQFAIYKSTAEKMAGKRVIIRTLDIGADKKVNYFNMPYEENPALGVRAIRICLKRENIFKTQLRALYRASVYGKIAIMFPMITSVDEIIKIKKICKEVTQRLKIENIPFKENVELGIMIETPASGIISDKLAKQVDFFSIGTNDLTQYTLAADRQNKEVSDFIDTRHLSILRLIKQTVDNAHKCGKWVGICGELGGDTELTQLFLAMGIDELSVSPAKVPELKKIILETDVDEIKDFVLKILD